MPSARSRAGRKKSDLPADASAAIIALKKWLRDHAGTTPLETIAAAASYSVSAVSSALGGAELPRLRLVQRIAVSIDVPQDKAYQLWWAAALEDFAVKNPPGRRSPLCEFGLDLRRSMLRQDLGQTDLLRLMKRQCAAEGGMTTTMSRATLCRLLAGTTLPRVEQMTVLLRVLKLPRPELHRLVESYKALRDALVPAKSPLRSREPAGSLVA